MEYVLPDEVPPCWMMSGLPDISPAIVERKTAVSNTGKPAPASFNCVASEVISGDFHFNG